MFHSQSLLFVPYTNPAPVLRADPAKKTNPGGKKRNRCDWKGRNYDWRLSRRFRITHL